MTTRKPTSTTYSGDYRGSRLESPPATGEILDDDYDSPRYGPTTQAINRFLDLMRQDTRRVPPSHKRDIVNTIRKLLRLSRANTPEGKAARVRADQLMERYGVHVKIDSADEVRLPVAGVTGFYWREQLLFAASQINDCMALKLPNGAACIAGLTDDARKARDGYNAIFVNAVLTCYECWQDWGWDRDSQGFVVAPMFWRSFLNAAATALVAEVTEATRDKKHDARDQLMRQTAEATALAVGGAATPVSDLDQEISRAIDEIRSVGQKITLDHAKRLQANSACQGTACGRSMLPLLVPLPRALPPAAPRSRFTELDL